MKQVALYSVIKQVMPDVREYRDFYLLRGVYGLYTAYVHDCQDVPYANMGIIGQDQMHCVLSGRLNKFTGTLRDIEVARKFHSVIFDLMSDDIVTGTRKLSVSDVKGAIMELAPRDVHMYFWEPLEMKNKFDGKVSCFVDNIILRRAVILFNENISDYYMEDKLNYAVNLFKMLSTGNIAGALSNTVATIIFNSFAVKNHLPFITPVRFNGLHFGSESAWVHSYFRNTLDRVMCASKQPV